METLPLLEARSAAAAIAAGTRQFVADSREKKKDKQASP